jgi:hypothetical protein
MALAPIAGLADIPPLVAAHVDLRSFQYMPLDVARLRDSDLAAVTTGDEFRAAVMLWCAAWHQVPAASLPDDDMVLSRLAGYGRVVNEWLKIRDGAMRGWIRCDDGRFYHPVVAEKANEAWAQKLTFGWKKECDRIRKENIARKARGLAPLEMPGKPGEIENVDAPVPAEGAPVSGAGRVEICGPSDGFPAETSVKGPEPTVTDLDKGKREAIASPRADAPPNQIDIEDLLKGAPQVAVDGVVTLALKPPAKPGTSIAEDARPTRADAQYAAGAKIAPDVYLMQWQKFRDYHRANGSLSTDWSVEWRNWIADLASSSAARKRASKSLRAARLREDWEPSAANLGYAESVGLTRNQVAEIAFEFKNYWLSEGGDRACKIDWDRAFTNRLLDQSKRVGGRGARASPNGSPRSLKTNLFIQSAIESQADANEAASSGISQN